MSQLLSRVARYPEVHTVSMPLANTEYKFVFPNNTRKFTMHTRDESTFRFAYEPGKVAGAVEPYATCLAYRSYWEDHLLAADRRTEPITIYFATSGTTKVMELIVWV